MRSVNAFVFPSRYEPMGLVLLEALAAALPVVTVRTAGGAEVIGSNCGIVLDSPDDASALAAAIGQLCGDEALAKRLRGIRPARHASRPASTAFFIAEAMSSGSRAPAMAVFINTPSQPSSMAMAASEAVPTPASTRIGTRAFSTMVRML